MAITTYSTFFTNINSYLIDTASQIVPEIFGLLPSNVSIHPKYKIRIEATGGGYRRPWTIFGLLQRCHPFL